MLIKTKDDYQFLKSECLNSPDDRYGMRIKESNESVSFSKVINEIIEKGL